MEELPVATARPRHFLGRVAALRGATSRWIRSRLRIFIEGRFAPLVLTGIFFSGMMLAMGYVADHAQRAAEAIDEAHRAAALQRQQEMQQQELQRLQQLPLPGSQVLFYIRPGDTSGR
jgi:hypothetical protein